MDIAVYAGCLAYAELLHKFKALRPGRDVLKPV